MTNEEGNESKFETFKVGQITMSWFKGSNPRDLEILELAPNALACAFTYDSITQTADQIKKSIMRTKRHGFWFDKTAKLLRVKGNGYTAMLSNYLKAKSI